MEKLIFPLGQRDPFAGGVRQSSRSTVKLPGAESEAALSSLPLRSKATCLPSAENGADARASLPQAKWFGHIVIDTEFQPNHSINLVAPMIRRDNNRHVRARADIT